MKKTIIFVLLSVSAAFASAESIGSMVASDKYQEYNHNYNFDYQKVSYGVNDEPNRITIVEAADRTWAVYIVALNGTIMVTRYVRPGYDNLLVGDTTATAEELAHSCAPYGANVYNFEYDRGKK